MMYYGFIYFKIYYIYSHSQLIFWKHILSDTHCATHFDTEPIGSLFDNELLVVIALIGSWPVRGIEVVRTQFKTEVLSCC